MFSLSFPLAQGMPWLFALALLPAATLGLMAAAREASEGRFPMPTVLASAFRAGRERLTAMLQLGAGWLMAEMLLFFIPALMSLLDYGSLLRSEGWRILLVIGSSTLLVMVFTALTVELLCRRSLRHEP